MGKGYPQGNAWKEKLSLSEILNLTKFQGFLTKQKYINSFNSLYFKKTIEMYCWIFNLSSCNTSKLFFNIDTFKNCLIKKFY